MTFFQIPQKKNRLGVDVYKNLLLVMENQIFLCIEKEARAIR